MTEAKPISEAKLKAIAASPMPDLDSFETWLGSAAPGAILKYAQGLWLDRRVHRRSNEYVLPETTRIVCKVCYRAYEAGRVELVQKKNGENDVYYLVIKRRDIEPPNKLNTMLGRGRIDS